MTHTRAVELAAWPAMATHSADRDGICPDPHSERRILRLAAGQRQLIGLHQLAMAGLGKRGATHRVAAGRLHRVQQNVFALHPPPYSKTQLHLAATMTYGPETYLSHAPSGALQGVCDESESFPAEVITPGRHPRSRGGIVCHRSAGIDPRDVRRFEAVPCVSVDLVLVQLAPTRSEAELEQVLVAAESKGFLKRSRLAELVAERRRRPGIGKLAELLKLEPAIVTPDLELQFLPVWRLAGLDRPRVNFPIAVPGRETPLTVDLAWPELRTVVEADSQRFHGDWERAMIDRERDQLLALSGWVCHRFVRSKIHGDLAGCAERLARLTALRARELSLRPSC